ncbi:MAG: hypothetical protein EXR71_10845 [Myxococcales bacterium]|nr:hypothetical protein [Myxococcales bacterium]
MKTSLEIDDRLYNAARVRAAQDHTTVRALIETGLAGVLGLGPDPRTSEPASTRRDLEDLTALCSQVSSLPRLTTASDDELLGYDDDGAFG